MKLWVLLEIPDYGKIAPRIIYTHPEKEMVESKRRTTSEFCCMLKIIQIEIPDFVVRKSEEK